jgi:16S rRNA (adenine1518-N6/adenine1519-N6)-dimethyltransferase
LLFLPAGSNLNFLFRAVAKVTKPLTSNDREFIHLTGNYNKVGGNFVRAKKHLGQHFLKDQNIARKITDALTLGEFTRVLEIGPGMGILTGFLLDKPGIHLKVIEIDPESSDYLSAKYMDREPFIIRGDFLTADPARFFNGTYSVIGNFPYNISSQIFFKILTLRDQITEVVGMVQKEVAERICHGPGSKTFGILSVLLQAFYRTEYLFTVGESVFVPPPKVKSAVIRLTRNSTHQIACNEDLFFRVVKTAFNQRRKILGNALKPLGCPVPDEFALKRAEQLSVEEFITLTGKLENPIS